MPLQPNIIMLFSLPLLLLLTHHVVGQSCPVDMEPGRRRDCYPWSEGEGQTTCEDRGCVWCPLPLYPSCFPDDEICPSEIAEDARTDCYPEGGETRELCNARSCIWCQNSLPGEPLCFYDSVASQGGDQCPTYIAPDQRIDCWPHADNNSVDMQKCLSRSCYWCNDTTSADAPMCFVPPVQGYQMVGPPLDTLKGYRVDLRRKNYPTWFGADVWDLRVDVEFNEDGRLRVKIYDPNEARFEVPLDIPSPVRKATSPLYDIEFSDNPAFHFKVIRVSTGEVLFDTSMGGLIFSDSIIQVSAKLPSEYVYGFGEQQHYTFKHDMNYKSWGMWTRDHRVTDANIYGAHPFFTCIDQPGANANMFGVLIKNANAQEVTLLPTPGLIYRTIGGVLDIYFFLGPSPEEVIQQYTQAIGLPVMPAYWALGFHLSRWGYRHIDNMKDAVDRMRQYDIPHDVQHGDIDYFLDRKDFTYDPDNYTGFPEYVQELKQEGTRFITMEDHFIKVEPGYETYDRGNAADVWVNEADGQTDVIGEGWPGDVKFPDYFKQSCQDWWINENLLFHDVMDFDGIWIDMNEPSSFIAGSKVGCPNDNMLNYPMYVPQSIQGEGDLAVQTLCGDHMQVTGTHFNYHSLYGWSSVEPTVRAARQATGKRSFVLSRSTYIGSGKYTAHWTGDNWSTWEQLHYSIIGMMEFNMFGIPCIGADICGYNSPATEEMCSRWMQLGSFYTFARNHNAFGNPAQDPGKWPSVAAVSRASLHIRYTLLPYLYTLFYEANVYGGTVIRPLLNQFLDDANTYEVDTQFMWGPAFMIAPVLENNAVTVAVYFPDARWYNWYDGTEEHKRGVQRTIIAAIDFIPLYIRGGNILPTQQPANSTMWSRSLPMGLIVALDDSDAATGSLFWDEGDTPDTYANGEYFLGEYSVTVGQLVSSVAHDGYADVHTLIFEYVKVYGENNHITGVTVNGGTWADFTYDDNRKVVEISNLALDVGAALNITWN